MKEQFDKKLVEKIKDSFLHHEESPDPKEWAKLSRAYFNPKNTGALSKGILWVSGLAASFALIFFLIPNKEDQGIKGISLADSLAIESKTYGLGEILTLKDPENHLDSVDIIMKNTMAVDSKKIYDNGPEEYNRPLSDNDRFRNLQENESQLIEISISSGKLNDNQDLLTEKTHDLKIITNPLTANLEDLEMDKALEMINEWLDGAKTETDLSETMATNEESIRLGLILSPQSISNATQSMNLGAGVLTEFSFSKRLKIDMGIAYAKQNLTPTGNNRNNSMDAFSSSERNANYSSNFISSSYELSFGQLEIPINLKYRIMEKDASKLFVITGVSNMFYLNQQNVGTFSTANIAASGLFASQTMVETFTDTARPSDGFSDNTIGRMLNFSMGYEYNLKNGTYLSLEPFYKLSVGNQTFLNQQFSIGGINLRMNFQLKK